MSKLFLGLALTMIGFDLWLHFYWVLMGRPLWTWRTWKPYHVFWLSYWGMAFVFLIVGMAL